MNINKCYELFKQYCEFMIEYYGLKQYEIYYCLTDLDNNRAQINVNYIGQIATFSFDENFLKQWYMKDNSDKKIIEEIKIIAFHEATELLLYCQWELLEVYYSHDVIQKSSHEIIRVLENTLFKEIESKIK